MVHRHGIPTLLSARASGVGATGASPQKTRQSKTRDRLHNHGEVIAINSSVKLDIEKNLYIPSERFVENWKHISLSIDRSASDINSAEDKSKAVRKTSASPATGSLKPKSHGYLGVSAVSENGLVRVRHVHRGSPAETSGLAAEDVITAINSEKVNSFKELVSTVESDRIKIFTVLLTRLLLPYKTFRQTNFDLEALNSKQINSALSIQLARIATMWAVVLLCATTTLMESASAQTPSIDRRVWELEPDKKRARDNAPRTVRVEGTGKKKITGKKSIRGKKIYGKKNPSKARASRKVSDSRQTYGRAPSTQGRDYLNRSQQPKPLQSPASKSIPASIPQIADQPVRPKPLGKKDPQVNEAFQVLTASLEKSVTQIVDQKGRSVLGTVVSSDGLIVSKNSLVDRNGKCIFSDDQQWPYRVIATDQQLRSLFPSAAIAQLPLGES